MKNISRRVFIKGLAVAGVAAAASTVLAGCNTNMIPGVDDGKDETPETPVTTITLTDPDKNTLTVVSKSFVLSEAVLAADKTAAVTFQVNNQLKQAVGFVDAEIDGTAASAAKPNVGKEGEYYVLVEAYKDGNHLDTVSLVPSDKGDMIATGATECIGEGNVATRTLNFDMSGVKKSLTVKMSLMKIVDITTTDATSKLVGEAQTVTYTL